MPLCQIATASERELYSPDPESTRARPPAASDEIARLRAALRAIAEGRPRSSERFAALVLDGASPEDAAADDDRRWRAEVGV